MYHSASDGAIADASKPIAGVFPVPTASKSVSKSMSGDPSVDEDDGQQTGAMYIPRVASLINLTEYMNRYVVRHYCVCYFYYSCHV